MHASSFFVTVYTLVLPAITRIRMRQIRTTGSFWAVKAKAGDGSRKTDLMQGIRSESDQAARLRTCSILIGFLLTCLFGTVFLMRREKAVWQHELKRDCRFECVQSLP